MLFSVLAVEILQSVRLIATSIRAQQHKDDEDDLPPARVMDILDETGYDVVQRLHQDFRFRIQVCFVFPVSPQTNPPTEQD